MFSKKRALDDFDEDVYVIDNSPPDEEIFKTSPTIKKKFFIYRYVCDNTDRLYLVEY